MTGLFSYPFLQLNNGIIIFCRFCDQSLFYLSIHYLKQQDRLAQSELYKRMVKPKVKLSHNKF
jgi:hypothetical protein